MPYKDPDVRKAYNKRYGKEWIKNLSPEQRERRRKYDCESHKRLYALMTPEEKKVKFTDKKRLEYATNPKVRSRRHLAAKTYYHTLRLKVLDFLGGRCVSPSCAWVNGDGSKGCTDARCLQIDHVFGNGTKETRSMSMNVFLRKVFADTSGMYQLLCANCNWIKRIENREHSKGRPISPASVPLVGSSGS